MANESEIKKLLNNATAKSIYEANENDRKVYETRGEDCAALTIPSLFPKASDDGNTKYTTPWQSVGARGVNNLASKLMLSLFPVETWMKLKVNEYLIENASGDSAAKTDVETALASVERAAMNYIESNAFRVSFFEALKLAVVTGNFLLYMPEPTEQTAYNPCKVYNLHSYVVKRDSVGKVLEIVALDVLKVGSLPKDVKESLENAKDRDNDEDINVYTHMFWDGEKGIYHIYQEVEDKIVSDTTGEYPAESAPFVAVRLVKVDGENYGRSYVEEYLGDLTSLENLSKAIIGMATIASKVIGLVKPSGTTNVKKLTKAQSGDFVQGNKDDITWLQLEKLADFSVTKQESETLERRLGLVFLLNSTVQRNAERVTAEEIKYIAKELEDMLGGVYSILSREMQRPIASCVIRQLEAIQLIPEIPFDLVNITISTGLEAIGRGQDLEKLNAFIGLAANVAALKDNPDINVGNLLKRLANSLGLDTIGLLYTDQEKQEMQQQQAAQQAMMAGSQQLGAGMAGLATSSPEALQEAAGQVGLEPAQ